MRPSLSGRSHSLYSAARVQIVGFCPRRSSLMLLAELRQEPAYLNPPNPLIKGANQGLRAFHRRSAAQPANSGPASEDAFPEEFRLRSTASHHSDDSPVRIMKTS